MKLSFKKQLVVFLGLICLHFYCGSNLANLSDLQPNEIFELGKKYFYEDKDYENSRILFDRISRLGIVTSYADSAQFLLAESQFMMENYIIAQSEYERLIRIRQRSLLVPISRYMVGMCYYNLSPKASLDQDYTMKAIDSFQQFVINPGRGTDPQIITNSTDRIIELYEKLAEKDYNSGVLYRKMRLYSAALEYLDDAMYNYSYILSNRMVPPLKIIPKAQFEKGECYIKLNQFKEAQESFQAVIDNFPQHYLVERAREKVSMIKLKIAAADTSGIF